MSESKGCDGIGDLAARLAAGDESVDPAAVRALEEHVTGCAPCSAEVDGLRRAIETLRREQPPDPGPIYWAAFQGRLRARLARDRRRSRLRAGLAIAVSITLVAGVGFYSSRLLRDGDAAGPIQAGPAPSAGSARSADALLDAIIDRAAARPEDRIALEGILDELVPADTLEIDDAIGTLPPSELDEGLWDPFAVEG